jgi:hypothetical protein
MNEDSIRQRFKYYRKEMLSNLLSNDKKFTAEEKEVIVKLIEEKEAASIDSPIIDGGIKDKAIIFMRWHIIFLAAAYVETFIFRRSSYGWHWIDGVVNYFFIAGGGLVLAALLFVFFTKKYKDNFLKNSFKLSVVATLILYIAAWNYCRISYSC